MGAGMDGTESNRDRVRRLLFLPLGYRAPQAGKGRMTPEEERAFLDGIADELSYVPDDGLSAMAAMLRGKGEGAARDFWPSRACFVGHAEFVCPRPMQASPALMRWFSSIEGPKAIAAGTLVETWAHVERWKVPPVKPEAQAEIRRRAAENASRLERERERAARGVVWPDEAEWARRYEARRQFCLDLVEKARAGKDAA